MTCTDCDQPAIAKGRAHYNAARDCCYVVRAYREIESYLPAGREPDKARQVSAGELVYSGRSIGAAALHLEPGTVYGKGKNLSEAEAKCRLWLADYTEAA